MMDAAGRVFGSNRLGLVAEELELSEESATVGRAKVRIVSIY